MTHQGLITLVSIATVFWSWIMLMIGYAIGGSIEGKYWRAKYFDELNRQLYVDRGVKDEPPNELMLTSNVDFQTKGPNNVIMDQSVDNTKLPDTYSLPDDVWSKINKESIILEWDDPTWGELKTDDETWTPSEERGWAPAAIPTKEKKQYAKAKAKTLKKSRDRSPSRKRVSNRKRS